MENVFKCTMELSWMYLDNTVTKKIELMWKNYDEKYFILHYIHIVMLNIKCKKQKNDE